MGVGLSVAGAAGVVVMVVEEGVGVVVELSAEVATDTGVVVDTGVRVTAVPEARLTAPAGSAVTAMEVSTWAFARLTACVGMEDV